MSLGLSSATWESTVAASPDALLNETSSRNIKEVLSKAVTRGPQKTLAALVLSHFESVFRSPVGLRVIQAIVQYGTVRTVSQMCKAMLEIQQSYTPADVIEELGDVIREVAVRVDDQSESRIAFLKKVAEIGITAMVSSNIALKYAAEVCIADSHLMKALLSSKKAAGLLGDVLKNTIKPKSAIHFVEKLISGCSDADKSSVGSFLLLAVRDALKQDAKHPRIEVLEAFAEHGDVATVDALTKAMASWKQLSSMIPSSAYAHVACNLLQRSSEEAGTKLAEGILSSCDVNELKESRTAAVLSVVVALSKRFASVCAKRGVAPSSLAPADVRLARATKPKFDATRQRIEEKLRALAAAKESIATPAPPLKKRRTA